MGCWLASAAFIVDRITKIWAMGNLRGIQPMVLVDGLLRFIYVENTGAAFGIFEGRPVFLLLTTGSVITGLLVWLLLRGRKQPTTAQIALWLLLGGALGNFVDRLFLGYVVDYIEFLFFSFPVFNVADISVCIAFAILAGWLLFSKEEKQSAE